MDKHRQPAMSCRGQPTSASLYFHFSLKSYRRVSSLQKAQCVVPNVLYFTRQVAPQHNIVSIRTPQSSLGDVTPKKSQRSHRQLQLSSIAANIHENEKKTKLDNNVAQSAHNCNHFGKNKRQCVCPSSVLGHVSYNSAKFLVA